MSRALYKELRAEDWLAAHPHDDIPALFVARAYKPWQSKVVLNETPLSIYSTFPMVREARAAKISVGEPLAVALRLGLVVAPPIIGRDSMVIDGLKRLLWHTKNGTKVLPIYYVVPRLPHVNKGLGRSGISSQVRSALAEHYGA